jgi:hypothetical protein
LEDLSITLNMAKSGALANSSFFMASCRYMHVRGQDCILHGHQLCGAPTPHIESREVYNRAVPVNSALSSTVITRGLESLLLFERFKLAARTVTMVQVKRLGRSCAIPSFRVN